jgi:hypothetical protein
MRHAGGANFARMQIIRVRQHIVISAAPLPIAIVEWHRMRRGEADSFSHDQKRRCNVDAWPSWPRPDVEILGGVIAMEPGAAA